MRRSVVLIVIALILATAGAILLVAGSFDRRMGIAQEDMAVLDFSDPQADYVALQGDLEKLPWVSASTLREIRLRRAALQYWQRDYNELNDIAKTPPSQDGEGEKDAELLLLAANASFRTTQKGPQDKVSLLKNLDGVIRAYADAIRAGSERPDAAFNYELAVKLRDELASGKRKSMPTGAMVEDKTDSNMHGDPGEPPKDMKVEQFQIRIPMDPKDFRSSQEQNAGTGQVRKRKG